MRRRRPRTALHSPLAARPPTSSVPAFGASKPPFVWVVTRSPPGLATPALDLRPARREGGPRRHPARVLTLHEKTDHEGGSLTGRARNQLPQARLRHDRVLML